MTKLGISYFGNRMIKHVKEDLRDIITHNCNLVIHTFSENDQEFYKETMKKIVEATHERGIEVWVSPWSVCGLFGGEAYSNLALKNFKYRQVSNTGKLVPALCLNKKGTKRLMKDWIDAAAEIGVDYIMWDEPHFYVTRNLNTGKPTSTTWCCRCKTCRKKYKETYKKEMPQIFTDKVKKFREKSIHTFMKEMSKYAVKKGVKVSIALTIWDMDNIERIMKIKEIETVSCDPYWGKKGATCEADLNVAEFIRPYAETLAKLGKKHKKKTLGWVQAFNIKEGTEDDVRIAVETFNECGVNDIAAWGYRGCGHMSSLKCDDASKVWKVLGEAYGKLKK